MKNLESIFKFLKDNQPSILIIGAIAAVAALFLGLDTEVFGESLRNLQLVLLLFLFLVLILFCVKSSFKLLKKQKKAGSQGLHWLLITYGFLLLSFGNFIIKNFQEELQRYLFWIISVIVLGLFSILIDFTKKIFKEGKMRFRQIILYIFWVLFACYVFFGFSNALLLYIDGEQLSWLAVFSTLFQGVPIAMSIFLISGLLMIQFRKYEYRKIFYLIPLILMGGWLLSVILL